MNKRAPKALAYPSSGSLVLPHDESTADTTEKLLHEHLNAPSEHEWRRVQVKEAIDARLQRVLDGEDASDVFKFGSPDTSFARMRKQFIAMEVLYLVSQGVPEAQAKEDVCLAYSNAGDSKVGIKTVQDAVKEWRHDPSFTDDLVRLYGKVTRAERTTQKLIRK